VALPWLILQQTGSAVAMGTVLMAGSIPRALLMLMGGAVSDRFSARKVMIAAAGARTVCVATIGILVWVRVLSLWELYTLAIAFGVADAFSAPAQSAYLPSLVKPEQMVAASSLGQSTAQLATILGPAPAGFVIKAGGIAWAFFGDAISFLAIIGALWRLPDPPQFQVSRPTICRSILEGLVYVGKDRPLRSLSLFVMIINFCIAGPVVIGLMYLSKRWLGSPAGFGIAISAMAAGSLLGSLLAGVWKICRIGVMILLASLTLGFCLASIGIMKTIWSIAGVQLIIGGAAAMINVHVNAWLYQRIDAAVRGRVSSVIMLGSFGLTPFSLALSGVLVAWNVKLMFLFAGGIVLLATASASFYEHFRAIK
jgi:MFS family permease